MQSTYERRVAEQRNIQRAIVHGTARSCSGGKFGRVCKVLWPFKTAEELAARVGCAIRTAAYEISGEREPSARSLTVVMVEITARE